MFLESRRIRYYIILGQLFQLLIFTKIATRYRMLTKLCTKVVVLFQFLEGPGWQLDIMTRTKLLIWAKNDLRTLLKGIRNRNLSHSSFNSYWATKPINIRNTWGQDSRYTSVLPVFIHRSAFLGRVDELHTYSYMMINRREDESQQSLHPLIHHSHIKPLCKFDVFMKWQLLGWFLPMSVSRFLGCWSGDSWIIRVPVGSRQVLIGHYRIFPSSLYLYLVLIGNKRHYDI